MKTLIELVVGSFLYGMGCAAAYRLWLVFLWDYMSSRTVSKTPISAAVIVLWPITLPWMAGMIMLKRLANIF